MKQQSNKQDEENQSLNSSLQSKIVQQKINHQSPYQTRESKLEPIQSKEGQKPPIQAKQRLVNKNNPEPRTTDPFKIVPNPALEEYESKMANTHEEGNTKGTPVQRQAKSQSNDLKSVMGAQYGVDLSGYKEHQNSSFPASVGAAATIQGKNIHYTPGQYTEKNRKHELGHAIDNTMNGTPKGDKVVNGQMIDTTREKAVDKIADTPLQRKESNISEFTLTKPVNTSRVIQRVKGVKLTANDVAQKAQHTAASYRIRRGIAGKGKVQKEGRVKSGKGKHAEDRVIEEVQKYIDSKKYVKDLHVSVTLTKSPCTSQGTKHGVKTRATGVGCTTKLKNFATRKYKGTQIHLRLKILRLYQPSITGAKKSSAKAVHDLANTSEIDIESLYSDDSGVEDNAFDSAFLKESQKELKVKSKI